MDLALISIPLTATKKKHDRIHTISAQLNFGALALASHLVSKEYSVKVFDPQHYALDKQLPAVLEWLAKHTPKTIGLSCISGFSYPNMMRYCSRIKKLFPNTPILAGGKDHLGKIAEKALEECPELSFVITGESETVLEQLLPSLLSKAFDSLKEIPNLVFREADGNIIKSQSFHHGLVTTLPTYNYSLYENFINHPASIEVSRGCTFKCDFCINDQTRPYLKKDIVKIIEEAEHVQTAYNNPNVIIYFQTPLFRMTKKELVSLIAERQKRGLNFQWRTQGRVDLLTAEKIELMAKAGAKVIDFGLESGSPEILLRMGKTKVPKDYLKKASELFQAAHSNGLIVKINILFYLGESWETLLETYDYITQNLPNISAISAYPVLIYPGDGFRKAVENELTKYGGSLNTSPEWEERHLTPINPSSNFSYETMQKFGQLFGKAFQTYNSFFNERRFCYYRPGVTFDDFLKEIQKDTVDNLPCSKDTDEMFANRTRLKVLLQSKKLPE